MLTILLIGWLVRVNRRARAARQRPWSSPDA